MSDLPKRRLRWGKSYRAIPSKYPPIDLFEDLSVDPAEWEILAEIEAAVNPRIRDKAGEISLVRPEDRVAGPGATWIMAPFVHRNELGSRFSDGTFGIYYAAAKLKTAIRETIYHLEKRLSASRCVTDDMDMRVLVASFEGNFVDLLKAGNKAKPYLKPDDYTHSQALGRKIHKANNDGIYFPSVRDENRPCVAIFRPNVIKLPVVQERHLCYHWNGTRISKIFDYLEGNWQAAV